MDIYTHEKHTLAPSSESKGDTPATAETKASSPIKHLNSNELTGTSREVDTLVTPLNIGGETDGQALARIEARMLQVLDQNKVDTETDNSDFLLSGNSSDEESEDFAFVQSSYSYDEKCSFSDNELSGYSADEESSFSDNELSGYSADEESSFSDIELSGYSADEDSDYYDSSDEYRSETEEQSLARIEAYMLKDCDSGNKFSHPVAPTFSSYNHQLIAQVKRIGRQEKLNLREVTLSQNDDMKGESPDGKRV